MMQTSTITLSLQLGKSTIYSFYGLLPSLWS